MAECAICNEATDLIHLPCSHTVCNGCLWTLLRSPTLQNRCPLCRRDFGVQVSGEEVETHDPVVLCMLLNRFRDVGMFETERGKHLLCQYFMRLFHIYGDGH